MDYQDGVNNLRFLRPIKEAYSKISYHLISDDTEYQRYMSNRLEFTELQTERIKKDSQELCNSYSGQSLRKRSNYAVRYRPSVQGLRERSNYAVRFGKLTPIQQRVQGEIYQWSYKN